MKLRKCVVFSITCSIITAALAPIAALALNTLPLNEITLQLHAEQWVNTTTALVSASVDAAVTDQGLESVRGDVLAKLNSIAKGDWHITLFNRQLDKSGLETVQITAEARLPQTGLASLRTRAKNISKPGETFTISDVAFTPSNAEIQQANLALRTNIYQQVQAELAQVNKWYPDEKYYVHEINFTFLPVAPMPMMVMAPRTGAAANSTPLTVSNKLTLDATVSLASTIPLPAGMVLNTKTS